MSEIACAVDFGTVIPTVERDALTYYVDAEIEGLGSAEFMVDTGSGYTAINEMTLELLSRAGKVEHVDTVYGTLANNEEIELQVYRISGLNIGGDCQVNNVKTVVLPGATRNILGLNTLKKTAPFALSVDPPQLMLSRCESKIL